MKIHQTIWLLVGLALTAVVLQAQQTDPGQAPSNSQQQTAPPAAFGQDNPPVLVNDNPPISGLDQPSLEPGVQPRSMLLGGLEVSESIDSNIGSDARPAWRGVTRGLGGLTMQKLWSRYQLAAAYVGGAGFYNANGRGFQQLHDLQAQQTMLWRRGQFTLRDSFSYLPEGSFGLGSYGGRVDSNWASVELAPAWGCWAVHSEEITELWVRSKWEPWANRHGYPTSRWQTWWRPSRRVPR